MVGIASGSLSGGRGRITRYVEPTTIVVNGVTATSALLEFEYAPAINKEIGVLKARFTRLLGSLTGYDNGDLVEVWRYRLGASKKLFSGYITRVEKTGAFVDLTCSDKLVQLKNREVTKSYDADIDASAGVISEIFLDLVTTYGGLNADASSVQDSGTTNTLEKYICRHASVFERCQKLAEALGWQFYYNASEDKVFFEPRGTTVTGLMLEVGENIQSTPKWRFDATQLKNNISLIGAQRLVETTELFSGDGATRTFELEKKPYSVKVFVNDTLQIGGSSGSTSGSYDYSVDTENHYIVFESGSTPPAGSNNIEVQYSYGIPTPVELIDSASIEAYGEHDYSETRLDIVSVADAEAQATELLEKYSTPFVSAELEVDYNQLGYNLYCGQQVRVVDSINSVDAELTITKIVLRYPEPRDKITVGDKEKRLEEFVTDINAGIEKLNAELTANQDLLLHIRSFKNEVEPARVSLQILKRGIGDSFVIGGVPNSTLDGKWTLEDEGEAWAEEYAVDY